MEIDLENTGMADERRFEALADGNRRRVLAALCESETRLSLTELAIELNDGQSDAAARGPDRSAVDRLRIELYHQHLPKLADGGFVDFDVDRRTVRLAPEFDEVEGTAELLAA